jgi:hypothetical protein
LVYFSSGIGAFTALCGTGFFIILSNYLARRWDHFKQDLSVVRPTTQDTYLYVLFMQGRMQPVTFTFPDNSGFVCNIVN